MDNGCSRQRVVVNGALPLSSALRRYFRRYVPAHEVDDLVQEVFLSLQSRRSDNPIEDIERYVFVVAGNLMRRRFRMRKTFVSLSEDCIEAPIEITPERIAIDQDRLRRVESAISGLPSRTRQVFMLHRFEDVTYSTIARDLGISVSAVEKHIIAALRALRCALGED